MNQSRKSASIIGILFIIATVSSVVSGNLIQSVIASPEDLANVTVNLNTMIIGILLMLLLTVSVVLIPAFLFPFLKAHDETLALGYFGVRIIEALTPFIDIVCSLSLVSLSQEFINAGTPTNSYFLALGSLILSLRNWAFMLNPIIFGLGALLLYYLLYKSKIIPQWLSGWGFVGAILVLSAGIMGLFGNFLIFLALPIAAQEMVMAAWLIIKGFNLYKS